MNDVQNQQLKRIYFNSKRNDYKQSCEQAIKSIEAFRQNFKSTFGYEDHEIPFQLNNILTVLETLKAIPINPSKRQGMSQEMKIYLKGDK